MPIQLLINHYMKLKKVQVCKHCNKNYEAYNGNQLYCCDVCRQQAYYIRHGIDRSQRPIYGVNVNSGFTPVLDQSQKTDVNPPTKEIEQITPAPVTQVTPLIATSSKNITSENFGAILEQMNKTHQAQIEALESRLRLSFEQDRHQREKQAQDDLILQLNKKIKESDEKSSIDTMQVINGLTAILNGNLNGK